MNLVRLLLWICAARAMHSESRAHNTLTIEDIERVRSQWKYINTYSQCSDIRQGGVLDLRMGYITHHNMAFFNKWRYGSYVHFAPYKYIDAVPHQRSFDLGFHTCFKFKINKSPYTPYNMAGLVCKLYGYRWQETRDVKLTARRAPDGRTVTLAVHDAEMPTVDSQGRNMPPHEERLTLPRSSISTEDTTAGAPSDPLASWNHNAADYTTHSFAPQCATLDRDSLAAFPFGSFMARVRAHEPLAVLATLAALAIAHTDGLVRATAPGREAYMMQMQAVHAANPPQSGFAPHSFPPQPAVPPLQYPLSPYPWLRDYCAQARGTMLPPWQGIPAPEPIATAGFTYPATEPWHLTPMLEEAYTFLDAAEEAYTRLFNTAVLEILNAHIQTLSLQLAKIQARGEAMCTAEQADHLASQHSRLVAEHTRLVAQHMPTASTSPTGAPTDPVDTACFEDDLPHGTRLPAHPSTLRPLLKRIIEDGMSGLAELLFFLGYSDDVSSPIRSANFLETPAAFLQLLMYDWIDAPDGYTRLVATLKGMVAGWSSDSYLFSDATCAVPYTAADVQAILHSARHSPPQPCPPQTGAQNHEAKRCGGPAQEEASPQCWDNDQSAPPTGAAQPQITGSSWNDFSNISAVITFVKSVCAATLRCESDAGAAQLPPQSKALLYRHMTCLHEEKAVDIEGMIRQVEGYSFYGFCDNIPCLTSVLRVLCEYANAAPHNVYSLHVLETMPPGRCNTYFISRLVPLLQSIFPWATVAFNYSGATKSRPMGHVLFFRGGQYGCLSATVTSPARTAVVAMCVFPGGIRVTVTEGGASAPAKNAAHAATQDRLPQRIIVSETDSYALYSTAEDLFRASTAPDEPPAPSGTTGLCHSHWPADAPPPSCRTNTFFMRKIWPGMQPENALGVYVAWAEHIASPAGYQSETLPGSFLRNHERLFLMGPLTNHARYCHVVGNLSDTINNAHTILTAAKQAGMAAQGQAVPASPHAPSTAVNDNRAYHKLKTIHTSLHHMRKNMQRCLCIGPGEPLLVQLHRSRPSPALLFSTAAAIKKVCEQTCADAAGGRALSEPSRAQETAQPTPLIAMTLQAPVNSVHAAVYLLLKRHFEAMRTLSLSKQLYVLVKLRYTGVEAVLCKYLVAQCCERPAPSSTEPLSSAGHAAPSACARAACTHTPAADMFSVAHRWMAHASWPDLPQASLTTAAIQAAEEACKRWRRRALWNAAAGASPTAVYGACPEDVTQVAHMMVYGGMEAMRQRDMPLFISSVNNIHLALGILLAIQQGQGRFTCAGAAAVPGAGRCRVPIERCPMDPLIINHAYLQLRYTQFPIGPLLLRVVVYATDPCTALSMLPPPELASHTAWLQLFALLRWQLWRDTAEWARLCHFIAAARKGLPDVFMDYPVYGILTGRLMELSTRGADVVGSRLCEMLEFFSSAVANLLCTNIFSEIASHTAQMVEGAAKRENVEVPAGDDASSSLLASTDTLS